MRLPGELGALTYCTNIHRGEAWSDVRENVMTLVPDVKRRVSPDAPFGVGLRLSERAARELASERELERFASDLAARDLYVVTLNGFPYGDFHRTPVKENVYRPDWREPERLAYTELLAHILARLVPEGGRATISTVPGTIKARAASSSERAEVAYALVRQAQALHELAERTGRTIQLALEPEPCCMLETVDETVDFFENHILTSPEVNEAIVRRHLCVCLDTCHAAVEFEDPRHVISALSGAGIAIGKMQLSSGLRVRDVDAEKLAYLERFADDVYLHQVVARRGETLTRYLDLPDAIAAAKARSRADDEWRVHFHVPIFENDLGLIEGTQPFLIDLLATHANTPLTAELEVETYTWDVLPPELRRESVTESIARELGFVREHLAT
jgi:sugar phosphate isomerase/epimerase